MKKVTVDALFSGDTVCSRALVVPGALWGHVWGIGTNRFQERVGSKRWWVFHGFTLVDRFRQRFGEFPRCHDDGEGGCDGKAKRRGSTS